MIPLRHVMKMYMARREQAAHGDRVFRESSTLRAAESVWSDVASNKGLGFRSGNAGPLLYGDLASGGEIEIGLMETNYSEVYCTVATVRAREDKARKGEVSLRPNDFGARLLRVVVAQPDLPEAIRNAYYIRSRPPELAAHLLGTERAQALLVEQQDRAPRLFYENGATTVVLEGIELVHDRIERIVDALSAIDAAGHDR